VTMITADEETASNRGKVVTRPEGVRFARLKPRNVSLRTCPRLLPDRRDEAQPLGMGIGCILAKPLPTLPVSEVALFVPPDEKPYNAGKQVPLRFGPGELYIPEVEQPSR